jgi:hypothetical protein
MEVTLEAQFDRIRAVQQKFDQRMEAPAPVDELAYLTTVACQRLQCYYVPQDYLDVSAVANGIKWNNYQLYAS